VYRDTWDLAGGAVEAEESPYAACRREVAEEFGLDRPPGRGSGSGLGAVAVTTPEGLMVVYDGGMLRSAEIDAIALPEDELAGSRSWLQKSAHADYTTGRSPDRGVPGG
jgi:8-oxo-dGTP diphosphatase